MFLKGIGPGEIIIVLAILLLLFGSTKVPQLARSLGQSIREFKKGAGEKSDEKDKVADVVAAAESPESKQSRVTH